MFSSVWGNLEKAESDAVGLYQAAYDGFGRRAWQEINGVRTYFVYDGDTIVAELDANGNPVVEYAWGLLGPIARLDLTNPSNSRYYILDALGHTRLLLDNAGNITDTYVYDAWGNLLKGSEFNTPNPFTWNGAFGYEWIEFTGLFHVGAREYDPRTARWLQRDPIDVASGDPNLYRYCFNRPVTWKDPSGLEIVIFVHGSRGTPASFDKSFISAVKQTLKAKGHVMFNWSGGISRNDIREASEAFCQFLGNVKAKHPNESIYVVGHSNGGNVAVGGAFRASSYRLKSPVLVDLIIRLGSPSLGTYTLGGATANGTSMIFNVYDSGDTTQNRWAKFLYVEDTGGERHQNKSWWRNIEVNAPCSGPTPGIDAHMNMHSVEVWRQIEPYIRDWLKGNGR
jgi:RHS repeat-associated protein